MPTTTRGLIPAWETLFLNLARTPPETLTRFAAAVGWVLRVLQAEQAPLENLERVLAEALTGLEGLPDEQAGQWLRAAWYLLLLVFHRREEAEYSRLGGSDPGAGPAVEVPAPGGGKDDGIDHGTSC